MQVNADFSIVATVDAKNYHWDPSTQGGVDRMMLDRLGKEKARATSVVRYASNSHFPEHSHPGGEEILVLSGTFSDQSGDYTQGWYLRNPPSSTHAPFSDEGATIFVKLWQMHSTDRQTVRINTNDPASWSIENGRTVCKLFQDKNETISLQKLAPDEDLFSQQFIQEPVELFVCSGSVLYNQVQYKKGSWLRLPKDEKLPIVADENGATVYLKVGNFRNISHGVTT